jgi:hypothetical protein
MKDPAAMATADKPRIIHRRANRPKTPAATNPWTLSLSDLAELRRPGTGHLFLSFAGALRLHRVVQMTFNVRKLDARKLLRMNQAWGLSSMRAITRSDDGYVDLMHCPAGLRGESCICVRDCNVNELLRRSQRCKNILVWLFCLD